MAVVHVLTAQGVKSIPLHAWPAEAFTSILGDNVPAAADPLTYYESVPWLYRGVNARADAVASIPHCFMQGDKEDEDYKLPFRLNLRHLLNEIEGDLTLYGAAYIWLDAGQRRVEKRQIRRLVPSSIKPIIDKQDGLVGFKRRIGSEEHTFSKQEIAHIWLPNRRKELGPGMPPGQAALRAAGVLRYLDQFLEKFFEQGTIAPVIIGVDEGTQQADVDRLESWLQRRIAGIRNAFGMIAVRGGVNPQPLMQTDLDKLAVEALNTQKREDIATALGVPHSLLFSNAANYATAHQDALNWYDMTIVPEGERIEHESNTQIFEPLLDVSLRMKPDRLEMYQAREAEKAYALLGFYQNRIITKNEIRQQAGFDPLPDGDDFEEPVTVTPPEPARAAESEQDGSEDTDRSFRADLRRWKSKALARLKAGKSLAFQFRSDAIEASLAGAIEGALEMCKTPADISRVFADAMTWGADHDEKNSTGG